MNGTIIIAFSAGIALFTAMPALGGGADPPKQYSIVEIAKSSYACRPAYSRNCILLPKGEKVVVIAWQIDENPRQGLYCLRPLHGMDCYYADLTAIEIDGVPVPTIGMMRPEDINPPPVPPVRKPQASSGRHSCEKDTKCLDCTDMTYRACFERAKEMGFLQPVGFNRQLGQRPPVRIDRPERPLEAECSRGRYSPSTPISSFWGPNKLICPVNAKDANEE
jgi:hypothetical protein